MSDEIKNEQQEQQVQPEVVVDETLDVKPEAEETEVKDESEAEVQDVAEDAATEEKDTEAEETVSEVQEETPTEQESEVKEDTETAEEPEVKSDEAPEASAEVVEKIVEAPRDEELEKAKAELAEKEAELQEEKAIKSYEDDVREANRQYDEFLTNLGNAMLQEFAKYGIDANTNLDELRKSDPAKAQVAENIIRQAQQAKDMATRNVQNNLNDRLTDVVFTKASRLFDKYELTHEQGEVAAETFVNILSQSGIRDMSDDLIAKVELAVARAKLLKPKVEKVIDDAKEVVKEAKEAVKDVIEAKAPEKEEKEEVKEETAEKEEVKEEQEAPKVESVVEAPSIDEFKESAVISNQAAGDAITEDNVLEQMAKLPFKERTAFYAQHRALCEKAMAKHSEAESKRKRI